MVCLRGRLAPVVHVTPYLSQHDAQSTLSFNASPYADHLTTSPLELSVGALCLASRRVKSFAATYSNSSVDPQLQACSR